MADLRLGQRATVNVDLVEIGVRVIGRAVGVTANIEGLANRPDIQPDSVLAGDEPAVDVQTDLCIIAATVEVGPAGSDVMPLARLPGLDIGPPVVRLVRLVSR